MTPTIYNTPDALQMALYPRRAGQIAFVPTMGALHEGHASLIRHAATLGQRVVVSIFVNPLQFGPNEDFTRYPRNFQQDVQLAGDAGATDVFYPDVECLTPQGMAVSVDPGPLAMHLCGKSRPGHFAGVCTIVAKLFHIVQPDVAVFGWKDAQQFVILRRMVQDLNFNIELVGMETVRESDGLAMSSRNTYLTSEERTQAPELYRALAMAGDAPAGESASHVLQRVRTHIEKNTSARIDYVEMVALDTLQPVESVLPGNTLVALAAWFGKTRLIDNVRL